MTASSDYTGRQIEAWAPVGLDAADSLAWGGRPDVDPRMGRRGVGTALVGRVVSLARDGGAAELQTYASLTARPLFGRLGFALVEQGTPVVRGVALAIIGHMALPTLGSSGTRSLESFRGQVVLLNLFASWCRPCTAETATLEQAQTRLAGQGATVLGVTYQDTSAASEAAVRAGHITYPVLRDVTGRFVHAFGLKAVPETFVVDRRGRIVAARAGEVSRRWLTQTLARVLPEGSTGRVSPIGAPIKSPPTASELARWRAVVTPRGESLYIVPAHRSICVVSSDNVSGSCQPFPYTATTPADIGAAICAPNLPSTELEVTGLMPPDAVDITVHYFNGSFQRIKTTNGMIAIYAPFKGRLPRS